MGKKEDVFSRTDTGISPGTSWGDTLNDLCFKLCVSNKMQKPGTVIPILPDGSPPTDIDYKCCKEVKNPTGAIAMCCGRGRQLICMNDDILPSTVVKKKEVDIETLRILRICVLAHEREHLEQYTCDTDEKWPGCKHRTMQCWKKKYDNVYSSEGEAALSEIECYKSMKHLCGANANCIKDIEYAIKRREAYIKVCNMCLPDEDRIPLE